MCQLEILRMRGEKRKKRSDENPVRVYYTSYANKHTRKS